MRAISLVATAASIALLQPTTTDAKALLVSLSDFDIPSFDYPDLAAKVAKAPVDVLGALAKDGIIALRNVPGFRQLRENYLTKAAECVFQSATASFVAHKEFDDGTKRYTVSASSVDGDDNVADATKDKCPGYAEAYQAFNQLVDTAVNSFGSALDQTPLTVSDGEHTISSRQLVSDAVRLDHFHLYEAAQMSPEDIELDNSLSLPLHEDHGLFVTLAAPKFFDVQEGNESLVAQPDTDNNCFMLQTHDGRKVRPVIKDDELVIMMGSGASQWLETSHDIPAVLHGMKMPPAVAGEGRVVRAWYGKMALLPRHQRMASTGGSGFEALMNATSGEVQTTPTAGGCVAGRQMMPSETSCTERVCTLKSGESELTGTCASVCASNDGNEAECQQKCVCEMTSLPAERCWMLCVDDAAMASL